MEVTVGVSNRHVHLTKEDYQTLFGSEPLEVVRPLVQTGEFASNQFVKLEANGRVIEKVRLIGPLRSYTQVEISKTDAIGLKIDPPIRTSGDLEASALIKIIGPQGSITKPCAILANRHIHINHETREKLGLLGISKVSVHSQGEKETTFHNVFIKEQEKGVLELHLDTDDANGAALKTGDKLEILIPKNDK